MKQECDHLKTRPLDQTNQEIMIDIKRSNNEIRELKESFESLIKSHELLQEHHTEVKKSHEILKDDHRKVTKEMETIKTSQKDTVPWNIRARINDTFKEWKDNDDTMFINTRAAQYVLKCIKENSCVTITASSGVGKTATLRHVALRMVEEGYDVLIVTEPGDILRFYNPNKKILFVVDDFCGNFSLDQSDIKSWEPIMEDIKQNLNQKQTKILAACRLQVYQDDKFDSLSVFKSCVCNMLSRNICLLKNEKKSIAKLYLKAKASEISDFYDLYDCFPLLCKFYHDNPELIITDFFQNPYSIYEAEINKFLKKGLHAKYCALALCVMFNNKLKEEIFIEEINKETRTIIENTCEACRLDRGTSRLVLQDELESLTHTYIKKEQNKYKILHDKIFDFFAKIFGQKIICCLIKNADSGLIKERFVIERKDDMDQFITIIPTKYHLMYIQRLIDDWSNGKIQDVFSNINMKMPLFTQKFLCYFYTLDISYQRRLANICTNNNQTPIMIACNHGHTEMVKMLLERGAESDHNCSSLVLKACQRGYTEILMILLDKGAHCNACDSMGHSLVMKACEYGHREIVKLLLDKGADCNKCDDQGNSTLIYAFGDGHIEIVKLLLDRGADSHKCNRRGQSPVMKACDYGHIEIVKLLLDRGADCNICDDDGNSPVMYAFGDDHIEIVKLLLDRGADCNKCDRWGQTPVMKACKQSHIESVKMLLDRGADCNKSNRLGQSPLMKACELGHTVIVKLLLDKGADYNKCDDDGNSPVMCAVGDGHIEIVKLLLDRGANSNKLNKLDQSPVMKACDHGHTEMVNLLLDRGADFNTCCYDGSSLVLQACKRSYIELVKMLLDRGADFNKCDRLDQSPVMEACEHGHTEMVRCC
ncbi:uncharacterized protein LOC127699188 [Mytilus californianus]|uniref:uncharacterized protein LOC127699188 n=1 Tax=Mytilus californianus TaxID=6549 RepID=UPI0022469E00|nr:uncharacterized protein LOC127699188 [Mytilus californianus]